MGHGHASLHEENIALSEQGHFSRCTKEYEVCTQKSLSFVDTDCRGESQVGAGCGKREGFDYNIIPVYAYSVITSCYCLTKKTVRGQQGTLAWLCCQMPVVFKNNKIRSALDSHMLHIVAKNKWGQLCTRTATPSWHIHWKGASDTSVNKMLFKSSNNKGRTRQKSGYSVLIVTQWSVIFTGCKLACREQWYMCSAWDRDALETIGKFFPNSSEMKLVTYCAYVMSGFVRFALVQSSSSPCRATFLLPCKYHFVLRAILHELPMHLNYHTPFFI